MFEYRNDRKGKSFKDFKGTRVSQTITSTKKIVKGTP